MFMRDVRLPWFYIAVLVVSLFVIEWRRDLLVAPVSSVGNFCLPSIDTLVKLHFEVIGANEFWINTLPLYVLEDLSILVVILHLNLGLLFSSTQLM